MKKTRGYAIGAALVAAGYVGLTNAQLGPLDPPDGAITDTGPSLAELEAKIDGLSVRAEAAAMTQGPWEVFASARTGALMDSPKEQRIREGRVFVHRIVSYRAALSVFDGLNEIDSIANTVNVPVDGDGALVVPGYPFV